MNNNLTNEITKILNDNALKDSLALPALKSFTERVERLEIDLEKSEQANDKLDKSLGRLQFNFDEMQSDYELLKVVHGQLEERNENILERELKCLRIEVRSDLLLEQIKFLKDNTSMLLRNAEMKKTLNSIIPVVAGISGTTDQNGYMISSPVAGEVKQENSHTNINESQE